MHSAHHGALREFIDGRRRAEMRRIGGWMAFNCFRFAAAFALVAALAELNLWLCALSALAGIGLGMLIMNFETKQWRAKHSLILRRHIHSVLFDCGVWRDVMELESDARSTNTNEDSFANRLQYLLYNYSTLAIDKGLRPFPQGYADRSNRGLYEALGPRSLFTYHLALAEALEQELLEDSD